MGVGVGDGWREVGESAASQLNFSLKPAPPTLHHYHTEADRERKQQFSLLLLFWMLFVLNKYVCVQECM